MNRSRPARLSGDDGAIMVEFALLAPLLALFAMGVLEFGMAWRDSQTIGTSMRSAARAVASTGGGAGDKGPADWVALRAGLSALGELDMTKIDRLIVYKANADDTLEGRVPEACASALVDPTTGFAVAGTGDICNVYGADWLAGYDPTDQTINFDLDSDGNGSGCPRLTPTGTIETDAWCPEDREADHHQDPDWVGVYVVYERDAVTGMFGDSFTMRDDAAYRIEPELEVS